MKKSTWIWIGMLAVFIGGGLLYRHCAQEVDSRGATRLMRALEENDIEKTRELLENGLDVHARDKSGQTALFYAARHTDDPLMLHKLVVAGADTFATDKNGYTPLMAAAQQNPSARVVMTLARYGRFLEGQAENKNRALGVAAQYNTAAIIKTLLIAGANPQGAAPGEQQTADLLAENPQLSEQEKADLRHVMLVLEMLAAREKFQRENYPKPAEKKPEAPAKEPVKQAASPAPKPEVKQMTDVVPAPLLQNTQEQAAPAAVDTPLVRLDSQKTEPEETH